PAEAVAVFADRYEPSACALADRHLGAARLRVSADVGEALLDDAEDLDLLVRAELHRVVDLEVDLQLAVGGEELDIAAKRRVEGRVPAGRGEREDGEARLLLGGRGGLLQTRQYLLRRCAALE